MIFTQWSNPAFTDLFNRYTNPLMEQAAASTGPNLNSKGQKVICQVCVYIFKNDDNQSSGLFKSLKALFSKAKSK
jgi:hypothetical protein